MLAVRRGGRASLASRMAELIRKQKERITLALRGDPERMKEIRARLGSLSWFMRARNEPIARRIGRINALLIELQDYPGPAQPVFDPGCSPQWAAFGPILPCRRRSNDEARQTSRHWPIPARAPLDRARLVCVPDLCLKDLAPRPRLPGAIRERSGHDAGCWARISHDSE